MTEVYAGLDVSDKLTHVCVADATGVVLWAGACATDPEAIELQIRGASKQLAAHAAADPVTAQPMTTPGVGPIIALVFKTSIADPGRFSRGQDAGAFAGLAPGPL